MEHPARIAILQLLASRECCFSGDIHEELPTVKATVSQHLRELREAGFVQGKIETPKAKYCINKKNWEATKKIFADFLGQPIYKGEDCCRQALFFDERARSFVNN